MTYALVQGDVDARDLPALRDLVRFGVMADDQIARRYVDPTLTGARLDHLKHAGIVDCWSEVLEGAPVYSPTRRAARIVAIPGLHVHERSSAHLAHDIGVVDLADYLIAQNPGDRWIAEYEIRGFLDGVAPSPRRLRGDTRHRPDGLLVTGDRRIAIELERTDKRQTRYTQISGWFVREWRVDCVRWYVEQPRILQRLREVNARHGFDRDMAIELQPFPAAVRIRQRQGKYRA
jgi:hypothetical protein